MTGTIDEFHVLVIFLNDFQILQVPSPATPALNAKEVVSEVEILDPKMVRSSKYFITKTSKKKISHA